MSSFVSNCFKCPLPFDFFIIFSTFADIFLFTFLVAAAHSHEESPHFCPKSLFQSQGKVCYQSENVCFKTISPGALGKSRVTWQSQNQNGVYMLRECGLLYNGCIWAWNSHFSTRNSLKWMILESRPVKETKRNVVQLNYILSFIFNPVLCIIYIATFRNSLA